MWVIRGRRLFFYTVVLTPLLLSFTFVLSALSGLEHFKSHAKLRTASLLCQAQYAEHTFHL